MSEVAFFGDKKSLAFMFTMAANQECKKNTLVDAAIVRRKRKSLTEKNVCKYATVFKNK